MWLIILTVYNSKYGSDESKGKLETKDQNDLLIGDRRHLGYLVDSFVKVLHKFGVVACVHNSTEYILGITKAATSEQKVVAW